MSLAKDSNKTQKISGDRRFIRLYQQIPWEVDGKGNIIKDEKGNPVKAFPWKLCIEPHADAIATRGASSAIAIADKGSFSDATTSQLLQTFQRTQVADIVRRLPFEACMAYLNSDLTKTETAELAAQKYERTYRRDYHRVNRLSGIKPDCSQYCRWRLCYARRPRHRHPPDTPKTDKALKEAEAKKANAIKDAADAQAALDSVIQTAGRPPSPASGSQ